MPTCPICAKPLETTRQREGVYYRCAVCDGRAVTVSQIRHVLGEKVAMKILRLMKLSRRDTPRHCPFCEKPMLLLNMQDPPLELEACRPCNAVWFDAPTYASVPQLAFESTSMLAMQATELIALERLRELKERQERERKEAKKQKETPASNIRIRRKPARSEHPIRRCSTFAVMNYGRIFRNTALEEAWV